MKFLCSRVTSLKDNKFRATFGNIVDLLTEKVDYGGITTLAQYYDVSLRCFTFPDFQISLTLEDIERLLNRQIKEYNPFSKLEEGFCLSELSTVLGINANELVVNWGPKGTVKGITQKFLENHPWKMIKEERPDFCSATLALLIYGIVLLPNVDKFIDHLAVKIFLTKNLLSFLLADFYHTFHTRHDKKGGTFLCCAPLLDLWMRTHMPQRGPFAYINLSWPHKFASLLATSILWYKRECDVKDVILRCGGFPNVPLVGTHGFINYNPMLHKRQLGYVMSSPQEDQYLIPFIINIVDPLNLAIKRVRRAWTSIIHIEPE